MSKQQYNQIKIETLDNLAMDIKTFLNNGGVITKCDPLATHKDPDWEHKKMLRKKGNPTWRRGKENA